MHGNVVEYCADWVHLSYNGAPSDGRPWAFGTDSPDGGPDSRVARGGMFLWNADRARSAYRQHWDVHLGASGGGFRVALDVATLLLDPQIRGDGITNAASAAAGPVAPGEICSIRGSNIGPVKPASMVLDDRGLVSTELSGIRVLFDGVPAPVIYASADQVNVAVPYAVASQNSTQIMLESQGQTSAPVSVPVTESDPGFFTIDSSGAGQAAAVNQDGSINSWDNPSKPGSVVSFFGTGEGLTTPAGVDGRLADSGLPRPVLPVQLSIGGVMAEVQYAGGAPGEMAGVLQVNARVPVGLSSGPQPVMLRVGQAAGPGGVFITVG